MAIERFRGVVAIGASAGGVAALQHLVRHLDPALSAPVLIVLHIGAHPSILPELLEKCGTMPVAHAKDGEVIRPGRIYVAPPDHHMLVEDGAIHLTRGPKEHHTRPAIDPLFRSVALAYGSRAIGVVMTGWGDDGTAGLQAIKSCGGLAFVQSPAEAEQPSMPMSALQYCQIDQTFKVGELTLMLESILGDPSRDATITTRPDYVIHEHQMFLSKGHPMEHLKAIGKPSSYVCPDCNGGLWEIDGARPRRFRCHTGHAYTLRSLQEAQADETDTALWNAMRGLEEKEMLLREVAEQNLDEGNAQEAARLQVLAHSVAGHAALLRELIEREEATPRTAQAGARIA
jgi:two-component system chemotaxis response regulator CheB